MIRLPAPCACFAALVLAGCIPSNPEPVDLPSRPDRAERRVYPAPDAPTRAKVFADTERDRSFGKFLEEHSGGIITRASVGIEKLGLLRVALDRTLTPEDALELTHTLIRGARREFADRPISLVVLDPGGQTILKARVRPGQGVRYELAREKPDSGRAENPEGQADGHAKEAPSPAGSGVTERDREFAGSAVEQGRSSLRFVEADLEREGRLWIGVAGGLEPSDVLALARALLVGARRDFPGKVLVATVFDPEGGRIGRARIPAVGEVEWAQ